MALKIGATGQGRDVMSDIRLMRCKMELMEYTVILANQKTIDKFIEGELNEKTVLVNSPMEDDQVAVVKDEYLKYSILYGKNIIDKCIEMERLSLIFGKQN